MLLGLVYESCSSDLMFIGDLKTARLWVEKNGNTNNPEYPLDFTITEWELNTNLNGQTMDEEDI